jgi:sugar lactone lactonase YvrE
MGLIDRTQQGGDVMAHYFATGVGAPEGPVCLPDGSMYVTEMSAATLQVTRLFPDGGRKLIKRTGGRPNGLAYCAFALSGKTLLVTEVERGRVEELATSCGGLPLHYPRLGLRAPN